MVTANTVTRKIGKRMIFTGNLFSYTYPYSYTYHDHVIFETTSNTYIFFLGLNTVKKLCILYFANSHKFNKKEEHQPEI